MNASVGRTGRIHDSLKLRLALSSVLLILASVALIVHVVLDEVHRVTEGVVLDSLENEARSTASVLSGRLIGLQLALRSAAGQLTTDQALDSATAAAFLDSKPVLGTMFSGVFVLAADGQMLALRDDQGTRDPGISVADRPYFEETLRLNRTLVSQPIMSRVSQEPTIVITFPVHDRNGTLHAMVGGSLRLSSRAFLGDLTQADREGDSQSAVVTIVTDSSGRIISHPSKEWVLKNGATEPRIAAAVADWVARGRPIESTGYSLHTDGHEVAIAGVPDADWVVFRSGLTDKLLVGVAQGEKRARWL